MFSHLIRYYSQVYFKNKSNIIWTFLFPFAYITIIFFALSGLMEPEASLQEEPIKIAIISADSQEESDLIDYLDYFSANAILEDGELQIIEKNNSVDKEIYLIYHQTDEAKAREMIKNKQINAIVEAKNPITIKDSQGLGDVKMGILTQFLDGYETNRKLTISLEHQYEAKYSNVDVLDYFSQEELASKTFEEISTEMEAKIDAEISDEILAVIESQTDVFEEQADSDSTNPALIYFFAAIGYLAFYPISAGSYTVEHIIANQSERGKRNSVSGVTKTKMFFASFLPLFIIQAFFSWLIYHYVGLLGVSLGHRQVQIVSLMILGNLAALLTGSALATLLPFQKNLRTALGIGIPLFFGFTSGMMIHHIAILISDNFPILHKINPVGIVSRGLYVLYSDSNLVRFFDAIKFLGIYILVFLVITLYGLRKNSYERL